MAVYWNGTRQEGSELLHAISAHCSCDAASKGVQAGRCPPHRMLVEDQRAINGLLFVRHIVSRLLLEEWDLTSTGWATADRRALPTHETPGSPTAPRSAHA